MIRSGIRAGSGREALAAAHVVTCEGVRRERARRRRQCVRDARGGRSLRGAGRVVAASEFLRVPSGLPLPAASRSVAPLPFQRLPPAARRSSGDEFRHLFRDDPGNALYAGAAGGRGRGGKMVAVPSVPLSQEKRASRGSALVWLPAGGGRAWLSRTFLRRGGDRQASALGDGGSQDLSQRTARKDDPPDESGDHRGLWASFSAVRSGCRLRFGALRAKTPRGRRVGTRSRPKSASVPGVRRGVAWNLWSPWTAGSFVPSPRCPLFLPSAGKRRREERGSGCPDVSALSDCAAGQSRPGVCGCLSVPAESAPQALKRGVPGAPQHRLHVLPKK